METPTKAEKVKALRDASPLLTHADACLLLGFSPNDPKTTDVDDLFRMLRDVSRGTSPKP